MHDWIEAFKTALWLSPIVFIVFMLIITDPITLVIIIAFLLGIILLITVTAMLVKLFWYIGDKYFE